jgi:hypothetical protein
MSLTQPDFLTIEEAFYKTVNQPTFIKFGDLVVGRKLNDEVFFEYRPNETITLFIKELLKKYRARVIKDYYNPNRYAFVLINGHRVFFAQDVMTYKGHTLYLLFPKMFTSDFKDLSIAHNVLQVIEGKKTIEEVEKVYKDVEDLYNK